MMLKSAQMKNRNTLAGLLLVFLGAGIFMMARTFPSLPEGHPGPGLFPAILGIGLLINGAVLLLVRGNKDNEAYTETTTESRALPLLAGVVLIILFPFLQPFLGTYPSLGLVGIGVGFTLRLQPLMVIITVVATLSLIYLAFNLMLGLPL
jgi:hypothetical protein